MPLSDLPQHILFSIFLLLFVLIGVYPAWKKTAAMLRKVLQKASPAEASDNVQVSTDMADFHAEPYQNSHLNDFEIFVLRRLAQESRKALSRRQINADLHLEAPMLKAALQSLLKRGLISMSLGYLSGLRFYLSASGRNYAIEQGFIPSISK